MRYSHTMIELVVLVCACLYWKNAGRDGYNYNRVDTDTCTIPRLGRRCPFGLHHIFLAQVRTPWLDSPRLCVYYSLLRMFLACMFHKDLEWAQRHGNKISMTFPDDYWRLRIAYSKDCNMFSASMWEYVSIPFVSSLWKCASFATDISFRIIPKVDNLMKAAHVFTGLR